MLLWYSQPEQSGSHAAVKITFYVSYIYRCVLQTEVCCVAEQDFTEKKEIISKCVIKTEVTLTGKGNSHGEEEHSLQTNHLAEDDAVWSMLYHCHKPVLYRDLLINQSQPLWQLSQDNKCICLSRVFII